MKWLLRIIIFLYVTLCGVLYFIQQKVIFRPEVIEEDFSYRFGEEVEIKLEEDLYMNALWVKENPSQQTNKAILYLHGNRGSIRFGTHQISEMKGNGYDVFIPDYRSYGKTEGQLINDAQMLEDAHKAFEYLATKYKPENIIVVGYSLGTGMAAFVASQASIKHLLLIAPFTSLTDIKNQYLWFTPDFLLRFKLNTEKHLKNVDCPISIIHGTNDQIVPFKFSKEMESQYQEKVTLYPLDGVGHRRVIFSPLIGKLIRRF